MTIDKMGTNCFKILQSAEADIQAAHELNTSESNGIESLHMTASGIMRLASLTHCQTINSGLPCAGDCHTRTKSISLKAAGIVEGG